MHILVDGRNTSDHFAISVLIKMLSSSSYVKPNRVYSTKLRWDRADLSQYQDACSSMLAQIHLGLPVARVIAVQFIIPT